MLYRSLRLIREFNSNYCHYVLCSNSKSNLWYVFENTGGHMLVYTFPLWEMAYDFLIEKGCVYLEDY